MTTSQTSLKIKMQSDKKMKNEDTGTASHGA